MEKFQDYREMAKKKNNTADHIVSQTFPLVKDPRLLLTAMENVFLAMSFSMQSILEYERVFKRVQPFSDNYDSKASIFQTRVMPRYNIGKKYLHRINELKEILLRHKKSPVEFRRQDRFVICDEDYRMKTISSNNVREYIMDSKEFLGIAETITKKNEEIFSGVK